MAARVFVTLSLAVAIGAPFAGAHAQRRGTAALHELIPALTVTTRVLIIGAHPDDDDPALIAWLARGKHVETAYLSLTRGETAVNLLGTEAGEALGAIRTQETLAARNIDGGHQYFGRAYDFGYARTATDAFKRWEHDSLLADVVRVVRSFRPHVVIAVGTDTSDALDGRHLATAILAREAYVLAIDSTAFPVRTHGPLWAPSKFYRHGATLAIDVTGYDSVTGVTLADVAAGSRAQHRSQGFPNGAPARVDRVSLQRMLSRVNDDTPPAAERSLFDGIDTTIGGLAARAPSAIQPYVRAYATFADSAARAFARRDAKALIRHLGEAWRIAMSMRAIGPWCRHPAIDAAPPAAQGVVCAGAWIELDPAADAMRRHAADAFAAAVGVSVVARAERDLLAAGESLPVTIDIANNGAESIDVVDVNVSGELSHGFRAVTLAPGQSTSASRTVIGLALNSAWWAGTRTKDLFADANVPVDGLMIAGPVASFLGVPGAVMPEEMRRNSDVTVRIAVAGMTIPVNAGPVVFRSADAMTGVQDRPLGGVPTVTLAFERPLEWIPANKPLDRIVHLIARSFSDTTRTIALEYVSPPGVRLDSLPKSITIAPFQRLDLFLRLRGMAKPGRQPFAVIGKDAVGGVRLVTGFHNIQYPHLPPIRVYHSSGVWLAAVDAEVPRGLRVGYVEGVGDAVASHLFRFGIPTSLIDPDALPTVDLTQFSAIVIGARAYDAHPSLVAHGARLLAYVRQGGTLVLMPQGATTSLAVAPWPITRDGGALARVADPASSVAITAPKAKLLTWPNRIVADDWAGWIGSRAESLPLSVDRHYATMLETHDAGEPENGNAIVTTTLGKGAYVYSSLTLHRQVPNGVLGSMRLLINLLSAGIPASLR